MEQSPTDLTGAATKFFIASEGFALLDALKIITRSLYNCRVFGYYGGIPKLAAMMKGIIIVSLFWLCILLHYKWSVLKLRIAASSAECGVK